MRYEITGQYKNGDIYYDKVDDIFDLIGLLEDIQSGEHSHYLTSDSPSMESLIIRPITEDGDELPMQSMEISNSGIYSSRIKPRLILRKD